MDKQSTNEAGAEPTSENASSAGLAPAQPATTVVEAPSTPAPAASETMPATDAATGAPVDTVVIVKPPKKKKTGLIVGIIVAILLILSGIGVAIWYFAVYQNPENVVLDAIDKLITAKNVSPHGTFHTTIASDNGYSVELAVTVDSSSYRLPSETAVNLMLTVRDASGELATDEAIKVQVGSVQMADGVAYLKLDNLTETLDQVLPNIIPPDNCAHGETNCVDVNPIEVALYEIADLLDEQWWRISISEILDEVDDLEDWQAETIKDLYACAIDVMNTDNSQEMSLIYRRNRFIDIKELAKRDAYPEGTTGYSVSLNYDALANFLNAAKHSSSTTAFYDCYNAAITKASKHADDYYYDDEDFEEMKISVDDLEDVKVSDLKKYLPQDLEIILHIDSWNHLLREAEVEFDIDDQNALVSVGFGYETQEVVAPSDARPITELVEEISLIINDLYYSDYPDLEYDDEDWIYGEEGVDFPIGIGI